MRIISSKVLNNNMCRIDYSLIVYIIETIGHPLMYKQSFFTFKLYCIHEVSFSAREYHH